MLSHSLVPVPEFISESPRESENPPSARTLWPAQDSRAAWPIPAVAAEAPRGGGTCSRIRVGAPPSPRRLQRQRERGRGGGQPAVRSEQAGQNRPPEEGAQRARLCALQRGLGDGGWRKSRDRSPCSLQTEPVTSKVAARFNPCTLERHTARQRPLRGAFGTFPKRQE